MDIPRGHVIDQRFEVMDVLGQGGMGIVYRAYDRATSRDVAVKVLTTELPASPVLVERFQRECHLMASISHPNVATLYAAGHTAEGRLYYAMELLDLPSLAELIDQSAPLPPAQVESIVRQLANALACVHEQGVVHRDLTPANVLLGEGQRVVLVDFGLARDLSLTALTRTGTVLGTPIYMSPELFDSSTVDGRSDIYQLGALAFEMLTGTRPFEDSNDLAELTHSVRTAPPPRPSAHEPTVPAAWDAIVTICMAKDVSLRYQSATELLTALDNAGLSTETAMTAAEQDVVASSRENEGAADGAAEPRVAEKQTLIASAPKRERGQWRPTGPRRAALVVALACLLCLFFILTRADEQRQFVVRDFVSTPFPGAIKVSWESDQPYPTRLRLRLLKPNSRRMTGGVAGTVATDGRAGTVATDGRAGTVATSSGELVEATAIDKKPTRRHELTVTGLRDGLPYDIQVLFPDGRTALPKRATAGSLDGKIIEVETSPAGLTLALHLPHVKSLNARCAGRQWQNVNFAGEQLASDRWRLFITTAALPLPELNLQLLLVTDEKRYLTLTGLLATQGDSLAAKLCAIDPIGPAKLVGRDARSNYYNRMAEVRRGLEGEDRAVDKHDRDIESARQRAALVEPVQEYLSKESILDDYRQAATLAPLVFHQRFLPEAARKRMYQGFMQTVRLFIFLHSLRLPIRIAEPLPDLADYSLLDHQPTDVGMNEIVLAPAPADIELGMVPLIRRNQRHVWKTTVKLPPLPSTSRPCIRLDLRGFRYVAAEITVNGTEDFLVFDAPMFDHEKDSPVTLWQRLPHGVLKPGLNEIAVSFEWIFDDVTHWGVFINRIALCW